jgi:hypothetical protein
MNPANLPFDSESMLAGLRHWVECVATNCHAEALNMAKRQADLIAASNGCWRFGDHQ